MPELAESVLFRALVYEFSFLFNRDDLESGWLLFHALHVSGCLRGLILYVGI